MSALQVLPPRQVAVLVLRDVLGFRSSEVAEMLESTVDSVNSALKRARATLEEKLGSSCDLQTADGAIAPSEELIVGRFVAAYESSDLDSLVTLLTDHVFISMPPLPFEYEGPEAASRFFASIFGSGRRFELLRHEPTGNRHLGPMSVALTIRATEWVSSSWPSRGSDQCDDTLRKHRASMVRSASINPEPIVSRSGTSSLQALDEWRSSLGTNW